jgi:hypothetical protein
VDLAIYRYLCGFKRFIASRGFPVDFSDLSLPLWILAIYRYLCGSSDLSLPVDLSDLSLPVDISDLSLPRGFQRFIAALWI